MIKWFFGNTPFECQIYTNKSPTWYWPIAEYYEIGVYRWSVGLGKYTFCWGLPKEFRGCSFQKAFQKARPRCR